MADWVSLFRTVQKEELDDLSACGRFRTTPQSIEGKLFWTTLEDAERFTRLLATRLGIAPSWIVEVRVERAVLDRLTALVTDGRPARLVHDDDLDWFNGVVMKLVMPASNVREAWDG